MAADNPYTGETGITIGGKAVTLMFDFRALAQIYADHGADTIKNFFGRDDIWQHSPALVASLVHIGLRKNHPEVTIDEVMEGLPPYTHTVAAITKALMVAYFGVDFAGEKEPSDESSPEDSKKN